MSSSTIIVPAFLVLGLAASQVQAEPSRRPVPLREALQLAARQSPDVAAAQARVAIARVGIEQAWEAWKPDISANAIFDHTNSPAIINNGQVALGVASVIGSAASINPNDPGIRTRAAGAPNTTIAAANSRYGTLQITQPLLTPQGLFLPGIANSAAEAAEHDAGDTREQVLLSVARTYLTLQGIEGLLAAAYDLEKVALRREKDARARIGAGAAMQIDLLRAQNDTAVARAQIASLLGQQRSELPLLEALVGEAVAPLPAAERGIEPLLVMPADEASEPWEHTYSLKTAVAQVRIYQRSVTYDEFRWMPSIAATARGNYNSNGVAFTGKDTTYDLIVGISVPLYDRGARYSQKHEDEAKLQQSLANLASTRARAKAAWQGARANLFAAQAVLEQSEAQVRVATRAQQESDVSYREGVATSLDLTDADNRLFQARSSAAQARANVDIRRAEVAAAEGRLYGDVAM
jgi:outer membrane protein